MSINITREVPKRKDPIISVRVTSISRASERELHVKVGNPIGENVRRGIHFKVREASSSFSSKDIVVSKADAMDLALAIQELCEQI